MPYTVWSYVASVLLDDQPLSLLGAQAGLAANPHELTLVNNLAVSYAKTGEITKAKDLIPVLPADCESDADRALFDATRGLVAYRDGDAVAGRGYYARAIRTALSPKLEATRIMIVVHQAIEEFRRMPIDEPFLRGLLDQVSVDADWVVRRPDVVDALISLSRRFESAKRGPDAEPPARLAALLEGRIEHGLKKLRGKSLRR